MGGAGVGRGAGEVQKKYSRKEKLNEKKKNSCTPINPKKYSYNGLKKFIQGIRSRKQNSCGSKIILSPIPPPPPPTHVKSYEDMIDDRL